MSEFCIDCKNLKPNADCAIFVHKFIDGKPKHYTADYAYRNLCNGNYFDTRELVFCKGCKNLGVAAAHLVCKKFEKSISIVTGKITYYDAYEARESEGMCGKRARFKVL